MAKKKKARRRLEKQLKKIARTQRKLLKAAKPAGGLAGAGALLGAVTMIAQRFGLGGRLEHAITDLRDRWLPPADHDKPDKRDKADKNGETARS